MKKILVVNNDADTMNLLKTWLERKSFEVKYTGNKDEVLSMISDFIPDLLLVDVLQKDVIHLVRDTASVSSISIILMTGYTLRSSHNNLPVDDTIDKPFDLALFESKIVRLVG